MQKKFTITATGAGDAIKLSGDERLVFGAQGTGGTDYVIDVQVKLVNGGNWYDAEAGIIDSELYITDAGVREVRYNCTDLGSATSIDFEITGQKP